MMRFWSMVAFSLLLFASDSAGKIRPVTLAELAGADVIAIGTVIRLSDDSYTLRVSQWLAGKPPRQELRIRRFVDWTCGTRTKPYEEGQRLLVFLQKGSGGSYSARGGTCEGEVFLEDGKAHLRFPLVPGQSESVAEDELVDAIPELRETRFERDDPDYAGKVRLLLKSERRVVRAATLQRLIWDAAKWHDPSVGPPFREVLLDAVVNPDCVVRATAASWLGMRLRGAAGQEALERLDGLAISGPAEARPAAALAATFIEPDDVRRHAVLLRTVADAALPVDDRRAVAAEMIHVAKPRRNVTMGVPGPVLWGGESPEPPRIAMADLREPALEALAAIKDEAVAIGVLAYLSALFDVPDPVPANIDPLKRAWAELFAAAPERD
jgi:hypothetical protein